MGMMTEITYGYGIDLSMVEVDNYDFSEFLKLHLETLKKVDNEIYEKVNPLLTADDYNVDEVAEAVGCYNGLYSSDGGNLAIVADIMAKETGISFGYFKGNEELNDDEAIMLADTSVWNLNDVEKSLTKEKLDDILNKYADELGCSGEVCHCRVEYFG